MNTSSCKVLLRTGTVVGYVSNQGIKVDVSVLKNCEQCAKGRGCGMGLVARHQQQQLVLKPDCSSDHYERCYPLGASVTFSLIKTDLTAIALLIYTLPLLAALTLSGAAVSAGVSEWQSVAIFFGALMSVAFALKYSLRGRTERFRPRLVS